MAYFSSSNQGNPIAKALSRRGNRPADIPPEPVSSITWQDFPN
ncbi:hypothetical protein COLO4_34238 [Corchorus olitorius]|uniref:Uncharacterized protein n=1 Tax=Corchorus olitorius TaxID=93759 RepID=A0A1R3GMR9_9ROSI|nr:hypothetical protein COLO4_34238 [Corchorus olitorius]